jgi:FkbM family methyltransferase
VVEFGSKYGGWGIDSRQISGSSVIVSFGLGEDVTFESALIERFGCSVFGFDPTPRSIAFVEKNVSDPRFKCFPCALADRDGTITFSPPPASAADQVSASAFAKYKSSPGDAVEVPCLTLGSIKRNFGLAQIDVLKLDIEGAEYSVIEQAALNGWLDELRQVLIEFHHFLPGLSSAQTRSAIATLSKAGFRISWIGRTNHEYLFTRKAAA